MTTAKPQTPQEVKAALVELIKQQIKDELNRQSVSVDEGNALNMDKVNDLFAMLADVESRKID